MKDLPALRASLSLQFGNASSKLDAASDGTPPELDAGTLDDLRRFVASHVARLLASNPQLLMSLLYRIDVRESLVRSVMTTEPPERIPDRLADLVVSRQLEKVRTRRRYRNDGGL